VKHPSLIFTCSHCDAQYSKWTGRCLTCGQWGTIAESKVESTKSNQNQTTLSAPLEVTALSDIRPGKTMRINTGILELDRVLGGGLVPGSFILIGGEPGIGKSTLAMQLSGAIKKTLYISGEESIEQIKLRADRLGKTLDCDVANATSVESIIATILKNKPTLTVIDSIQTVASDDVLGEAGSVNQVRASAVKLMECAKQSSTAIVIIGHVTKDGMVAGPKTLEHLVDTVLSFEGDEHHATRILRAIKNRFGSIDEVGVFEMVESGLREVPNPSERLLISRGEAMPGSILTCLMEGSRPLLVEIQALVNKTVFGYPVRKASGFDLNRLHVLTAVLQKRAGINLAQYDIHLNVVGGIIADEPAADLAVCLAIASAYKDKMLGNDLVVFGEVGLGGEVRSVPHTDKRIKETIDRGLKRVIAAPTKNEVKIKIIPVRNIQELITHT
jgi:DNA repair protein RadA/Sms